MQQKDCSPAAHFSLFDVILSVLLCGFFFSHLYDGYYVGDDGKMLAQTWFEWKGKKYYLNGYGAMVVNWKRVGRKWYFFDADGAMVIGWQDIDEAKYYLFPDGHMAQNEWVDGKWLNRDGSQTYPYIAKWITDDHGKRYIDDSGWFPKNTTQTIDGKEYEFDAQGYAH